MNKRFRLLATVKTWEMTARKTLHISFTLVVFERGLGCSSQVDDHIGGFIDSSHLLWTLTGSYSANLTSASTEEPPEIVKVGRWRIGTNLLRRLGVVP